MMAIRRLTEREADELRRIQAAPVKRPVGPAGRIVSTNPGRIIPPELRQHEEVIPDGDMGDRG